jgi:hypothetical protein
VDKSCHNKSGDSEIYKITKVWTMSPVPEFVDKMIEYIGNQKASIMLFLVIQQQRFKSPIRICSRKMNFRGSVRQ